MPKFELSLVCADADIQEIVVHASSDRFSGETRMYVAPGDLGSLANVLAGFPASREDHRAFELGQADLTGYGRVQGWLYCLDSSGHLGLYLEVFQAASEPTDKPEHCSVLVKVVPSDLDRFVDALRNIGESGIQVATLKNAA